MKEKIAKTKVKTKKVNTEIEAKSKPVEDIKPVKKKTITAKKVDNIKVVTEKFGLDKKVKAGVLYLIVLSLVVAGVWQNYLIREQSEQNKQIKAELVQKIDELKKQTAQEFVDARRIYICNMEEIYKELQVEERNKNFELEIAKLNNEVKSAQNKINSLKNAKVKANYSDVYLNSLVAKRDKVSQDYQDALQQTLANVNQALSEVAKENSVNTIFRSKATSVMTKYTIDVTPQVLEKIKNMQQE